MASMNMAQAGPHTGMDTPQAIEQTYMPHTHVLTDTGLQEYFSLMFLLSINPLLNMLMCIHTVSTWYTQR